MQFSPKVSGLRWLLVVWLVYTAVWMSREGALWQVVIMGPATAVLLLGYGWERWLGGKSVGRGSGTVLTAVSGLLLGSGSAILSLVFMAVKTGLHAHGPEFSQAEITWIMNQLPLWTVVGLLVGLGIGLIWAGHGKSN